VRVFGSVARGDDTEASDVDLLVRLAPGTGLLRLGRLVDDLERVLGVRVDVVPESDLKPDLRARVEAEAVPL
jgi:predicted nucleotidyltransferase